MLGVKFNGGVFNYSMCCCLPQYCVIPDLFLDVVRLIPDPAFAFSRSESSEVYLFTCCPFEPHSIRTS